MLPADELQAIRAEANAWLPSLCQVLSHAQVADGGGGFTETYTPAGAQACRLAPVAGGEDATSRQAGGDRISDRSTHILTLQAEAVIREADRVRVDGADYEVVLVRKRPALEAVRRVELREAS